MRGKRPRSEWKGSVQRSQERTSKDKTSPKYKTSPKDKTSPNNETSPKDEPRSRGGRDWRCSRTRKMGVSKGGESAVGKKRTHVPHGTLLPKTFPGSAVRAWTWRNMLASAKEIENAELAFADGMENGNNPIAIEQDELTVFGITMQQVS